MKLVFLMVYLGLAAPGLARFRNKRVRFPNELGKPGRLSRGAFIRAL